jgi:hypothetical protein
MRRAATLQLKAHTMEKAYFYCSLMSKWVAGLWQILMWQAVYAHSVVMFLGVEKEDTGLYSITVK